MNIAIEKDPFIKLPEVINLTSLSRAEIYRRIKKGTFPKPIPAGERRVAWLYSEINDWKKSRIAMRQDAA